MKTQTVKITKQKFLDKVRLLHDAFPGQELKDKRVEGIPLDLVMQACGSPSQGSAYQLLKDMERKGIIQQVKDGKSIKETFWLVDPHEIELSSIMDWEIKTVLSLTK